VSLENIIEHHSYHKIPLARLEIELKFNQSEENQFQV